LPARPGQNDVGDSQKGLCERPASDLLRRVESTRSQHQRPVD
jgi:hypothetical protein